MIIFKLYSYKIYRAKISVFFTIKIDCIEPPRKIIKFCIIIAFV